MGKKLTKKLLVFLTLMCMIIGMNVSVSAETGLTGNTKAISAAENPADGTLQVWLEYEDDNGNSVALSGGSCFLINEEYVLSNYHIFNLNEEIAPGVTIRSAAMETLGLSELKDNDPHLKIRVYANRDMSVLATIHDSVQSQTMDYVAMKLSDKIYDRKPLALGDSSTVQQTQTVNAYGFPEDSIENKEFNTAADVSATDGTISKLTVGGRADFFERTAQLNHGDSGGPLVDSNKSVSVLIHLHMETAQIRNTTQYRSTRSRVVLTHSVSPILMQGHRQQHRLLMKKSRKKKKDRTQIL